MGPDPDPGSISESVPNSDPDPDSDTGPDVVAGRDVVAGPNVVADVAISKKDLKAWKFSPSLQMVTAGKSSSVTGFEMVFRFVIVRWSCQKKF